MQIPKEEKLAQLNRVLQGRTLQGSESLKAFLRFVVDKVVDDAESQLKEYVIATEVFGRGSEFDSRIDSVVRVQAGRLRSKLQEYYATEGKDDQIILELPKGQYTPTFRYRTAPPAGLEDNGVASTLADRSILKDNEIQSIDTEGNLGIGGSFSLHRRWKIAAIAFAILSLALFSTALFYRSRTLQLIQSTNAGTLSEVETIDRREIAPFWGPLLSSTEPVLVVYSNTLFQGTAEEGMKLLKKLDSPGSSLGSPNIPQSGIENSNKPIIEHYTGIGEVMGAYFLGDFFAKMRHPSRVKRSLLLNWEDLKTENIVVLGSPAENLFLRDLPQKQDLIFRANIPDKDDGGKPAYGIVNTKPQPGEQPYYFARQGGPSRSQISEDYAVISVLQGLNSKNRLLILAGITTLGTQAAAEYVTRPSYIRDLISRLDTAPAGNPPALPANFQVLVKVKVNGGVPIQLSYETHHVVSQ
jgi:hypothetical protein